jgi:hydrogenase maturation factor HypE
MPGVTGLRMGLLSRGATEDTQHAALVWTINLTKSFLCRKSQPSGRLVQHAAKNLIVNSLDGILSQPRSVPTGGSKGLGDSTRSVAERGDHHWLKSLLDGEYFVDSRKELA